MDNIGPLDPIANCRLKVCSTTFENHGGFWRERSGEGRPFFGVGIGDERINERLGLAGQQSI